MSPLVFERSHLKQLKEKHLTSLKESADLRPRSPPGRARTWGQSEADSTPLSAGLGRGVALAGDSFPRPCPSPSPLHLQLEQSLEGRRHFLCPPPPISQHSWQAQRREGDKEGKGAWKWGVGGCGARRRPAGQEGALRQGIPRGVSARPAAPADRRGAGTRAFRTRKCQAAGSWDDCPVLGH